MPPQPPYGGYVTESNSPSQYPQRYPMQVEQGNNHVDLQRSRNMEEISYYGGGLPTGAWDVQQHLESSRPPYGPHSSVLHAPAFPQFPRTHRVKITVVSASDLIKRGFFQLPDPYVELQVDCELAYTTSTVKTTLNPYWDKGTEVTVTDSSMIMVKVYDMRKSQKPGSGILGKVEFCVDNVLGPDYSELKTLTTDLTTFSLLPSSRGKITLRLEPIATISPGQSRLPNTGPVASHLIERLCLQCRNAQCIDGKVYCGLRCVAISRNGAPKLVELPAAHYMFRRISDMFKEAWRHHTTAPTPQYIFVIVSTEENDRMYNAYKQGIESQRNFLAQNLTEGNEQYRWYGTIRECNVGDPGRGVLCTSAHCSTCWVIRHSFDVDRFGQDCGSGRGVYSSADSFTANRHSKTFNQSPWTAQLLTSVVVGGLSTGYDKDGPKMPDYPPDGHDRIGGQRGKPLTYNGTVVYRNDAIRPMYLVLYLTPRAPSS
ncbi:hypothetical protein M408DRAFT_142743 [Serendipita vermifera MAFF 305830]|uniref:C2 domain-containing protein n=1 Tax=Serendipita vermifera MAFF 305830 TaxID=933852 RepID=A0A0C3B8L9_SERVB|nr:hypothetical protein M408DRAFT_142743 [Serendipita vermifera MAFF 305830]